MGGEWRVCRLKDMLELVADNRGRNPSAYASTGVPVIDNYLILSEGRPDLNNVNRYIDEETYDSFIRKHIQKDDVLVTLVGNGFGKVAITPEERCVIIQNTIGLRCNKSNFSKYLYYLLKNNRVALMNLDRGAAQPSIKVGDLLDISFKTPPLEEQKNIAHILGTLDDKIELNRQMNTTLESMAQALFKSWFVDFDPVIDNALAAGNPIPEPLHARAEIRKNLDDKRKLLPAAIQQQFPSSFVFSAEMGWIPEGWMIKEAQDIATISIGKTPPRKERQWFTEQQVGNVVWVSIKDMGVSGVFIGKSSEYLVPESIEKYNVRVIPKDSVILSFKMTLGRVSIAQTELATNEAIAHFVDAKLGLTKEYIFSYLKNFDYESLGSTSSIATAVNSKLIKAMPFVVPCHELLGFYQRSTSDWFEKISSVSDQVVTLSNLRDYLLPNLLSGQLRVPDTGKTVGKVSK